jgi:hypothetical protein
MWRGRAPACFCSLDAVKPYVLARANTTPHLADTGYDEEALEKLLSVLLGRSGILRLIEDGRARFAAPHWGFQKP